MPAPSRGCGIFFWEVEEEEGRLGNIPATVVAPAVLVTYGLIGSRQGAHMRTVTRTYFALFSPKPVSSVHSEAGSKMPEVYSQPPPATRSSIPSQALKNTLNNAVPAASPPVACSCRTRCSRVWMRRANPRLYLKQAEVQIYATEFGVLVLLMTVMRGGQGEGRGVIPLRLKRRKSYEFTRGWSNGNRTNP